MCDLVQANLYERCKVVSRFTFFFARSCSSTICWKDHSFFFSVIILFKFLLLFSYSCLHFLPLPPEKTILSPLNYLWSFVRISRLCLCESREFSWVYEWTNQPTNQQGHNTPVCKLWPLEMKRFNQHHLLNTPMILECPWVKGEFSYTCICRKVIWEICFSIWRWRLFPPWAGQTCVAFFVVVA